MLAGRLHLRAASLFSIVMSTTGSGCAAHELAIVGANIGGLAVDPAVDGFFLILFGSLIFNCSADFLIVICELVARQRFACVTALSRPQCSSAPAHARFALSYSRWACSVGLSHARSVTTSKTKR